MRIVKVNIETFSKLFGRYGVCDGHQQCEFRDGRVRHKRKCPHWKQYVPTKEKKLSLIRRMIEPKMDFSPDNLTGV